MSTLMLSMPLDGLTDSKTTKSKVHLSANESLSTSQPLSDFYRKSIDNSPLPMDLQSPLHNGPSIGSCKPIRSVQLSEHLIKEQSQPVSSLCGHSIPHHIGRSATPVSRRRKPASDNQPCSERSVSFHGDMLVDRTDHNTCSHDCYWQEYPIPTGITDDDEDPNESEDTDGSSLIKSPKIQNYKHLQWPSINHSLVQMSSESSITDFIPPRRLSRRSKNPLVQNQEKTSEYDSTNNQINNCGRRNKLWYSRYHDEDGLVSSYRSWLPSRRASSFDEYNYRIDYSKKYNDDDLQYSSSESSSNHLVSLVNTSYVHQTSFSQSSLSSGSCPSIPTANRPSSSSSSPSGYRYSTISTNPSYNPIAEISQLNPPTSSIEGSSFPSSDAIPIGPFINSNIHKDHHHTNSNNGTTPIKLRPPPLPGRRLQFCRYNGIFLICFFLSVLLGILFHHSKIYRINPSLSIEGFERLVPSLIPHRPSVRRINLGALLATDLLLNGWGSSMSPNPYPPSTLKSLQLKPPNAITQFHSYCPTFSISDNDLSILNYSTSSMCHVHQDLILRQFCPTGDSPSQLIRTDWNSSNLSCPLTYEYSLSQSQYEQSSIYESHLHQRFAPLLLCWRQITPLPPTCSQSVARYFKSHFQNRNFIDQLQYDVYNLILSHPKLISLRRSISLRYFDGPISDVTSANACNNNKTDVLLEVDQEPTHPNLINETIYLAQQFLDFLESIGIQFYSIGKSAPLGLIDHSVWIIQTKPFGWFSTPKHKIQHNSFKSRQFQGTQTSSPQTSFLQSPLTSLQKLYFHWDIHDSPFSSIWKSLVSYQLSNNDHYDMNQILFHDALSYPRQWFDSNDNSGAGRYVLLLFNLTKGILSPAYLLHYFIKWLFTGWAVYLVLFIGWIHSLASPNPVTLVHFPRLIFYQLIVVYRIVILYMVGGFLQTLFGNGLDFSDHIVLYMTTGMILSLELTAAERSHQQVPVVVSKEKSNNSWRRLIRYGKTESENHSRVDQNEPESQSLLVSVKNVFKICFDSDAEDSISDQPSKESSPLTPSQIDNSKMNEAESSTVAQEVKWREPYAVQFVRFYSLILFILLCYTSFFTSLFFHHPSEAFMGLAVGLFGLYVPFWLLVFGGCLSLEKFGIPRGNRSFVFISIGKSD